MDLNSLSRYLKPDEEKQSIINDLLFPADKLVSLKNINFYEDGQLRCEEREYYTKYCPKCFKKYVDGENFCYDCLCALKKISEMKKVSDIKSNPKFTFEGTNNYESFDEIFTPENMQLIEDSKFMKRDFNRIVKNIKTQALKNMDELLKTNEIDIDGLGVSDKVLLFSKSFVTVDYKSQGRDLGYFEFNQITIDDRQTSSLQITTLIHELSHFLLKELLTQIICKILDCTKSPLIESIATFILSYSHFTQLIDEYSAHTVEGRFAVFGYQDYSSFLSIEQALDGEMTADEIEITKSIGNTFAISIKDILESFIDDDLRVSIKDLFLLETHEKPNYDMLVLENCNSLTNDGFMKAIRLILTDGFNTACINQDKLIEYEKFFLIKKTDD